MKTIKQHTIDLLNYITKNKKDLLYTGYLLAGIYLALRLIEAALILAYGIPKYEFGIAMLVFGLAALVKLLLQTNRFVMRKLDGDIMQTPIVNMSKLPKDGSGVPRKE